MRSDETPQKMHCAHPLAYLGFCEGASAGCAVGCPPPTGEGSGKGAVPSPDFFLNFWFKMGHFLFKTFYIQAKGGASRSVPPPLNTTLRIGPQSIYYCSGGGAALGFSEDRQHRRVSVRVSPD